MEDEKFISGMSSADFDTALNGGLAFANGGFVSDEQKASFMEEVVAALPTYNGEVEDT